MFLCKPIVPGSMAWVRRMGGLSDRASDCKASRARFGAVPVVRRTGGLNDTVFDVDHDAERAAAAAFPTNGFSFEGTDAAGLDYALNRRGPVAPWPPCIAPTWLGLGRRDQGITQVTHRFTGKLQRRIQPPCPLHQMPPEGTDALHNCFCRTSICTSHSVGIAGRDPERRARSGRVLCVVSPLLC